MRVRRREGGGYRESEGMAEKEKGERRKRVGKEKGERRKEGREGEKEGEREGGVGWIPIYIYQE